MEESFDLAIKEHMELQRRNRMLESEMPLAHYLEPRSGEPGTRQLSSPEPSSRRHSSAPVLEDTQEWVLPEAPTVMGHETPRPPAEDIWAGTPAFDWGD